MRIQILLLRRYRNEKGVKIFVSIITALAVAAGAVCLTVTFAGKKYTPAENTAYKVLQITDVHILNNPKKDAKAFKTITEMVNTTHPDLIMVTGDITSEKENMTAFHTFGEFMESFKIPWAFVFGNHEGLDNGHDADDVVDGMGNYYRNVTDKNSKVIMSLIMMDSNSYDSVNNGYDHFHDNQVAWYEKTVKQIAKQVNGDESRVVPSIAFFHIPMQEFKTAYDKGERIAGARLEKECSPAVDDQMFETMEKLGSTVACFAGHDHMNNYSAEYHGIRLSYGLSCDHNIYVVPFRGGQLINIKNDGTFTVQRLIRHRGQSTVTIGKEK